jgi:hypothetical protein
MVRVRVLVQVHLHHDAATSASVHSRESFLTRALVKHRTYPYPVSAVKCHPPEDGLH